MTMWRIRGAALCVSRHERCKTPARLALSKLKAGGPWTKAARRLVSLETPKPMFEPDPSFLAWFERFLDCTLEETPFD
jgi:hypothetical protein